MKIAVAADGSRAAICELARIVIVEIPGGARIGELVFDTEALAPAHAREAAWIGDRLLVLSRYPTHTHVAYVEITRSAPHTLAELQIDEPIELRATTERCALVTGATAAYLLAPHGDELGAAPFATPALPVAACGTSTTFVVALPDGVRQDWDPATGGVRGELSAGASDVRFLGANDRGRVWAIATSAPAILDAGERRFVLPEAIRAVACNPASDLVACLGDTGAYACDLGRDGVTTLALPGRPIAIALARGDRAIVAQEGGAVSVIALAVHVRDDWRGRLVRWAAERGGTLPSLPPIEAVLRARSLDRALAPAVALLYAAHVVGEPGCAPVDIAQVVGRWTEALGTGMLAADGIAVYAESRVALADDVQRELDAAT